MTPVLARSALAAAVLLALACAAGEPESGTEADVPAVDAGSPDAGSPDAGSPDAGSPDAVLDPGPDAVVTDAERLREIARRLAGLEVAAETGDGETGDGETGDGEARWRHHGDEMDDLWRLLEERHFQAMRAWAGEALAGLDDPRAPLLYPFSGPDLVSALQFFPDASSYVLIGLEPAGRLPSLERLSGDALGAELERLRGALSNLVEAGYFVTKRMESDLDAERLEGQLPLLFAFCARAGFEPVAVRFFTLDDGGAPVSTAPGRAPAVEIELEREGEAEPRRLYYFSQDLSDGGLAASPGFGAWLRRLGAVNAYMKSASYLLHMDGFERFRDLLLESAESVLQDDSGVPLADFDRERWRLDVFGRYRDTLPPYREWYQEELRDRTGSSSSEPLPFAIGYNRDVGGGCLIWARKRPVTSSATSSAKTPADAWPQFRGPAGDGHAPSADLPLEWSEEHNVAWKVELPGRGWSSPVVEGGEIWLTTALDGERSLRAVGVERESGRTLHEIEVFRPADWQDDHPENSRASPTPVIENGRLYVHFGTYGTAAVDTADGTVVWRNETLQQQHEVGPGSSPILWRDLLIVNCDATDSRFVAAFDKRDGRLAWTAERSVPLDRGGTHQKAFSTPLVVHHDGAAQLVSAGAGQVSAYRPEDGAEIWRVRYDGYSIVPRPVAGLGMVFVDTGYIKPHLLAIRLGGRGDVTDSHVVWRYHWQVPANPSPLLVGDRLYMVNDWGNASWLDARRGEDLWRKRLRGRYWASPIHARGRIYNFSQKGRSVVLAASDHYRQLADNRLDGEIRASPAAAGDQLYVRTTTHLYRIERLAEAG